MGWESGRSGGRVLFWWGVVREGGNESWGDGGMDGLGMVDGKGFWRVGRRSKDEGVALGESIRFVIWKSATEVRVLI